MTNPDLLLIPLAVGLSILLFIAIYLLHKSFLTGYSTPRQMIYPGLGSGDDPIQQPKEFYLTVDEETEIYVAFDQQWYLLEERDGELSITETEEP